MCEVSHCLSLSNAFNWCNVLTIQSYTTLVFHEWKVKAEQTDENVLHTHDCQQLNPNPHLHVIKKKKPIRSGQSSFMWPVPAMSMIIILLNSKRTICINFHFEKILFVLLPVTNWNKLNYFNIATNRLQNMCCFCLFVLLWSTSDLVFYDCIYSLCNVLFELFVF